jgi:two-component system, OmpR family, response regulator
VIDPRRVLLIDDNDDHRSMLANALRARGWSVEIARDGQQGLAAAARCKPDLVVTELVLPDVRGFHFARTVRTVAGPDVFVIALTRLPKELHGRALTSGFDHVQCKHGDIEDLHNRMLRMTIAWPRATG